MQEKLFIPNDQSIYVNTFNQKLINHCLFNLFIIDVTLPAFSVHITFQNLLRGMYSAESFFIIYTCFYFQTGGDLRIFEISD